MYSNTDLDPTVLKPKANAGGSVVELRLMQDSVGKFIQVRLRSDAKPGFVSQKAVRPEEADSEANFIYMMEVTAGALAEHQCNLYGDRHDPEACAKTVKEVYQELKAEIESQQGLTPAS